METAFAALASLGAEAGIAGTAAAAGGAGAGAAAAGGLGSGLLSVVTSSPVLAILSGGASAVSIMQQLQAGDMRAEGYELQRQEAEAEAVGVQTEHHAKAAAIKRELLKTLGENDVAFAASGIDISYGVAADRRASNKEEAYGEIAVDRATSDARVASYNTRSLAYERLARQSRSGARLAAFATGLEGGARAVRRGVA